MPCVTGEEKPIADWLAARFQQRGERVRRVGNSVVVGAPDRDRPTVLLVGHLDVVPPTGADEVPRHEGARIVGRGASDMKSGLAVAIDLFDDPELRRGGFGLQLVAYAGEEGPHAGNELGVVLDEVAELRDAALAIVLEPTDLQVQLGCLGGLHAEVTFRGRAAHSARPWQGSNALTRAGPFLADLHERPVEETLVDGLTFREVITPTQAWTSNAHNVVPDRFCVNLNYRFAPDKTLAEAEEHLRQVIVALADDVEVVITDRADPAPPRRSDPLVERLAGTAGAMIAPKQAWTDVARFAAAGVAALNYGPGLTAQAHQSGEYVPVSNLMAARAALAAFLRMG